MCSNAWPPLGILYCATVLAQEGIEVKVLDQAATGLTTEEAAQWVKKVDPSVLGLSVLVSSSTEAQRIVKQVKEENENIFIVLGNYHPTFNAERILEKYPHVDAIARGEAEFTCLELAKCLDKGWDLKKVDGITYRNHNARIVSTPDRPLVKDVNSLPFPDRDLLDCEYTSKIFGIRTATKKFTTLLSSRGCPFQCTFCACQKFARRIWRPRSVKNMIEEIEFLYSEGYEEFLFVDDNFTLNSKRVMKFCNTLLKKRVRIRWFCDSRVDNCGFETFRYMVKAGCRTIYFGIESANQRILDYYKKSITPRQSETAIQNARRAGVDIIIGSFIVGAPDESRREILQTLKFAKKIEIDIPSFNILCAPVGSPLWNELVSKRYIDEEKYWDKGVFVPKVAPNAVPFEDISSMIFQHFKAFFFNPKKLFSEAVRMLASPFRFGLLVNNLAELPRNVETVKLGVQFK